MHAGAGNISMTTKNSFGSDGRKSDILLLRSAPTYVHFFGVIKFKLVDTLPAPAAEKLVFDDPFAARTRCVCSLVFIDVNLVNAHRPAVGRG